MQYCTNCGQQLEDNAKFCSSCGQIVAKTAQNIRDGQNFAQQPVGNTTTVHQQPATQQPAAKSLDMLCLVGFILSFFITIVGLILSIIGYQRVKKDGPSTSKTLAVAGIIFSSIATVIYGIVIIAGIAVLMRMVSGY